MQIAAVLGQFQKLVQQAGVNEGEMIMELFYQENWETIKKRLTLLWDGEILDRPCVAVSCLKDEKNPFQERVPKTAEEWKAFYTDPEWILERSLDRFDKSYYGGDALPMIFPYWGCGGHAKYLGGKAQYVPGTIWIEPAFEDYNSFDFSFAPDDEVLQAELRALKYLAEAGKGKFFVAPPDNCGSYDALSELRGGEDFITDLLDEPELVKKCGNKMVDILIKSGDMIFDVLRENNDGGSVHGWMNTWCPGKHMQLQCDLSVMISADMYREFIVEDLERSCQWLDRAIYHLDGMEQIRHIDLITSVKRLSMVQWTQVDGQPDLTHNFESLHRIQKAGKGLVLQPYKRQLNAIVNELPLNGVMLVVLDAANKQEADEIVDFVAKHSFKKTLY